MFCLLPLFLATTPRLKNLQYFYKIIVKLLVWSQSQSPMNMCLALCGGGGGKPRPGSGSRPYTAYGSYCSPSVIPTFCPVKTVTFMKDRPDEQFTNEYEIIQHVFEVTQNLLLYCSELRDESSIVLVINVIDFLCLWCVPTLTVYNLLYIYYSKKM